MPDLTPYLETLATLVGFAALFTIVIAVLKRFGVIADGDAGRVSLALNFALLGFVVVAKTFGLDLTKFDNIAAGLANIIAILLGLVAPPLVSRGVYRLARGRVPVIGFSHSQ